jgi:sucrose-6-phosphate hydrolase SacC (GH32 family)
LNKDADLFAPESVLTPDGRRVMWAWSRVRERLKDVPIQSSIQSLPRELSLPADGRLRIKPLRELAQLRYDAHRAIGITVKDGQAVRLKRIAGDSLELKAVIQPGSAKQFGVQVYCDADGKQGFPITFEPAKKLMSVGETKVPFELRPSEDVTLRVYLDKSIIEVFVNDRQAAITPCRYSPENLGINMFSKGGSVLVKEVIGWRMRSIYEGDSTYHGQGTRSAGGR